MSKMNWSRILLAGLIVIIPISFLIYYEVDLSKRKGWSGIVSVLTEPLVKPKAEEKKKDKQQSKEPLASKIATSEALKKKNQPEPEKAITDQRVDEIFKVAASESSVPARSRKKAITIEPIKEAKLPALPISQKASKQPLKDLPELHLGKAQKGTRVPNLNLHVGEAEIKELLQEKLAYLVVKVGNNSYLLSVTNSDNPYQNVEVVSLKDKTGLSERYMVVSRKQLSISDLASLDSQVVMRTGRQAIPHYSLVFSSRYNYYMTGIQLGEIKTRKIDLDKLHTARIPVSMSGELRRSEKSIKLYISEVKVNGSNYRL